MAIYTAGVLTGAGSTTLPIIALTGGTTVHPRIVEIGLFNTTATAVALKLCRLSTAGTPGATITAGQYEFEASAPVAIAKTTYTVAPTITDLSYRAVLGASIGSGVVFTFPDTGLVIPNVANAGIGVVVENGTGQPVQAYLVWRE
jgi:hypothetical protein